MTAPRRELRRRWTVSVAAVLVALVGARTSADAREGDRQSKLGVPGPGLDVDPPEVQASVVAASVTLAGRAVRVRLTLRTSDTAALVWTSPLVDPASANGPYPDRQFPELRVRVDGAVPALGDRYEAFFGKSNITQSVKLAGMDPWAIARKPPVTPVAEGRPQVLHALTIQGAVVKRDDQYLARWSARRLLRIPLGAAGTHEVVLEYTARPSVTVDAVDDIAASARDYLYCVTPTQLRRRLRAQDADLWQVTEYEFGVGIGEAPTARVSFTFNPEAGAAALFACGAAGKPLAALGTVTRQVVRSDDHGRVHVMMLTKPVRAPADR